MRRKIEIAVEKFNKGELTKGEMVNEILLLSIVKNNEVKVCQLCKENVLMTNGCCPKCTIDFCTPLEQFDL